MNSFAVGRKILYKENWDKRISFAIDNLLAKENKKANSYLKAGLITQKEILKMTPMKKVIESFTLNLRTNDFYKSIAKELIKADIKWERK